jgi:hypothetical protein
MESFDLQKLVAFAIASASFALVWSIISGAVGATAP